MANIEKISVSGTSYDVRDANAAHALTDIANAGNNITFTTPTIDDYSIQGTGVTVTDGVASGFSSSSYVYKGIWNTIQPNTTFDFVIKFRLDSFSAQSYLTYQKASTYNVFNLKVDTDGRLWFESQTDQIKAFGIYVTSYSFATNVDYWVKLHYEQSYDSSRDRYYSSIYANVSTDGTNYTQVGSNTGVIGKFRTSTDNFILGSNLSNSPLLGSIDLTETYFKDGEGNILWAASAPAGVPQINAIGGTVDQTYNASSANAQSGVAVAGAIAAIPLPTTPELVDIARAGDNITFTNNATTDYETVGTGVTVTSAGVASGFNSSGYLQKGGFWGSLIGQTDFTFITKFKINSSGMRYLFTQGTANNDIQFYIAFQNTNLYSGISTNGAMHTANASNVISYGTDYWLKFDYSNARGGIDVYLSTDGVNWGSSIASGSATGQISNSSATALFIGGGSWSPLSNYALTDGSLDLSETYASVGGNEIWRAFISGNRTAINAVVDQIYDGTSTNAQSGVAINGAGFLRNESTSTTLGAQGLSIGGNNSTNGDNQVVIGFYAGQNAWSYSGGTVLPDSQNLSIGFGAGSMPYTTYGEGNIAIGYLANSVDGILGMFTGYTVADHTNCIAIGSLAHAYSTNGIAIGSSNDGTTTTATEASLYSIAVGSNAKALANRAIAIGTNSSATGNASMAFGRDSEASANYAIQLGRGTNSTASTMNVGLSSSLNVQLLDSSGNIPAARLINAVQGALNSSVITLSSNNWSNSRKQSVTVTGMTSTSFVWVSPAPTSANDYASAGVLCIGQSTNSLEFSCETEPSVDISVQVVFG